MTLRLVYGADHAIAAWVRARCPWVDGFGGAHAIGIACGPDLVAGVVFANYRGSGIEVSIAADHPRWARKGVLRALFAYPFIQLGCRRITALIPAKNEQSLRLCQGLGFSVEGRHPALFPDDDGVSLGLLREHCKWLGDPPHDDRNPGPP
jgi:RimJ/RimL family protein N-acetyltransferase